MATGAVHESWRRCPLCGRDMAAIRVAIATPPFVVELIGCEDCGITTNEQSTLESAAAAAPERRRTER